MDMTAEILQLEIEIVAIQSIFEKFYFTFVKLLCLTTIFQMAQGLNHKAYTLQGYPLCLLYLPSVLKYHIDICLLSFAEKMQQISIRNVIVITGLC